MGGQTNLFSTFFLTFLYCAAKGSVSSTKQKGEEKSTE